MKVSSLKLFCATIFNWIQIQFSSGSRRQRQKKIQFQAAKRTNIELKNKHSSSDKRQWKRLAINNGVESPHTKNKAQRKSSSGMKDEQKMWAKWFCQLFRNLKFISKSESCVKCMSKFERLHGWNESRHRNGNHSNHEFWFTLDSTENP